MSFFVDVAVGLNELAIASSAEMMVTVVDVQSLRDAAADRALKRPRVSFSGVIDELRIGGVFVRRYSPQPLLRSGTVYFAHGGYGLFGTLDLQDGYCRILAQGLGCIVVAVDYRLAPESTLGEAVEDFIAVARSATVSEPVLLAGDSAGGAIAVSAAADLPKASGLLLTNPNLDLSLAAFDSAAPEGPDLKLSRYAFTAWVRPNSLADAPRLHEAVPGLPDAFVSVGVRDALVSEARTFSARLREQGRRAVLCELADAGHGFMGDVDTARLVVGEMNAFLVGLAV